jgi:glycosyltransferase involved in cell wall biosynthesis
MDLDDVPSTYLRTVWEQSSGLANRSRHWLRMTIARRRERLLCERFSALAVCSDNDRDYLGLRHPVHVIPNGFGRPAGEPGRTPASPPRIGFIGKFGYAPNDEGMRWFISQCWPQIERNVPGARLRIVGLGGENFVPAGARQIDALGWVDDATSEIAGWSVMVVPLLKGSGTRLKIAEGFSRKCPIVSTSLGAYGYTVTSGQEIWLADAAPEFASACIEAICNPEKARHVAERAWAAYNEKWTWDAIRPRICAAAESCLRDSHDHDSDPQTKA